MLKEEGEGGRNSDHSKAQAGCCPAQGSRAMNEVDKPKFDLPTPRFCWNTHPVGLGPDLTLIKPHASGRQGEERGKLEAPEMPPAWLGT